MVDQGVTFCKSECKEFLKLEGNYEGKSMKGEGINLSGNESDSVVQSGVNLICQAFSPQSRRANKYLGLRLLRYA